jgi:uroporphyrinogen-III synthase
MHALPDTPHIRRPFRIRTRHAVVWTLVAYYGTLLRTPTMVNSYGIVANVSPPSRTKKPPRATNVYGHYPIIPFLSARRSTRLDEEATTTTGGTVVVALTREEGKNDKLRQALLDRKTSSSSSSSCQLPPTLRVVDVPCIAHASGPDFDRLQSTLQENHWDYVVVTSPEAARVLASVWKKCEDSWNDDIDIDDDANAASTTPSHRTPAVAAVGKATEHELNDAGIVVAFVPSKATAATLVRELPIRTTTTTVLYPASARAPATLEEGLTARCGGGVQVTRLDTYDTVTALWTPTERLWAQQAHIVCFASPSAVSGWMQNVDPQQHDDGTSTAATSWLAACIGETSAEACREHGWSEDTIFYPEKPGMEGWVEAVARASATVRQHGTVERIM